MICWLSTASGPYDAIRQAEDQLQSRVEIAGLEVVETKITHLAYAPGIAAAMLQTQQAPAIIAATKMIVDGAVGMADMALNRLGEDDVVHLNEERKAPYQQFAGCPVRR